MLWIFCIFAHMSLKFWSDQMWIHRKSSVEGYQVRHNRFRHLLLRKMLVLKPGLWMMFDWMVLTIYLHSTIKVLHSYVNFINVKAEHIMCSKSGVHLCIAKKQNCFVISHQKIVLKNITSVIIIRLSPIVHYSAHIKCQNSGR